MSVKEQIYNVINRFCKSRIVFLAPKVQGDITLKIINTRSKDLIIFLPSSIFFVVRVEVFLFRGPPLSQIRIFI